MLRIVKGPLPISDARAAEQSRVPAMKLIAVKRR
jgi:hypothetical protein